jgi:hypothetical protein
LTRQKFRNTLHLEIYAGQLMQYAEDRKLHVTAGLRTGAPESLRRDGD